MITKEERSRKAAVQAAQRALRLTTEAVELLAGSTVDRAMGRCRLIEAAYELAESAHWSAHAEGWAGPHLAVIMND